MLKVDNRYRKKCEICSKLTITTWLFTPCSSVSINFAQVTAGWTNSFLHGLHPPRRHLLVQSQPSFHCCIWINTNWAETSLRCLFCVGIRRNLGSLLIYRFLGSKNPTSPLCQISTKLVICQTQKDDLLTQNVASFFFTKFPW